MRQNIMLEFSARNNGIEGQKALDLIENDLKSHELFLVEWQREDQKIRVFSKFSEIMDAINVKGLSKYQKSVIQYKKIEEISKE